MNEDTKNIKDTILTEKEESSSSQNELKRINVYKLVKNYNGFSSIKLKESFLTSQIKIVPYIGYGTKMFLADQIVKNTCLKDKNIYVDSCKRYILYIYTLLKYWTNLDIEEKDLLVQYDLLDQNDLVEKILALIPEKEIATFKTILDMKQNDIMTNNYNVQSFINNKLLEFYPEFSKAVMPLVENLNDKLNNFDKNDIIKIMENLNKFVS